ncbi:aldo/keto reductase [Marinobacter nanhaiticus D15-8W]|uniref:Aldo/keto reductase n=1 Tax=Marinobacter nanhaiticus D15-8W TaxID=626887 RepID=N6W0Q3_9GAMM|nr:aldo/keto reductase [Marinobacter nanhaiticus]ENO13679.1 aldo/keto reductase [Marinobacter nanhaiticus D15-8W]BES71051.1 aldo/keto reductase [Marinobacter nanhaiticus D15-8W]
MATPYPELVLGFMRLLDYPELGRPNDLARWIETYVDQGLDTFDHADIYGSTVCESAFGEALKAAPSLRNRVRVITKADIVHAHGDTVKHYCAESDYISSAIDSALQRLNIEQIDTFLIHRPDPLMHAPSVARALEAAVEAGKVAQIGVSNFLPEQWRWLQANTRLPLVCNQSELSLRANAALSDGTIEAHLRDNLHWLAWSPLGGGNLQAGKLADELARISNETGLTSTALAIAWLRMIPGTPTPVLGSMRAERIAEARAGLQAKLPRTDWFALLEAARGQEVP